MSAERPGESRAWLWVCPPLVILLLYVATWPPIEIKCTTVTSRPLPPSQRDKGIIVTIDRPAWAETVYRPLHLIRDHGGSNNLLARYWYWWAVRDPRGAGTFL